MKVKFANKVFEVLHTMEVAGKTMYAVEDEPNHIDWLVNVEVVDDEKKESDKSEQEPYPETLDKAIDLYYYTYGNGKGGFDHLSLEKFKGIVKMFVDDYGMQNHAWSEEDEFMATAVENSFYLHCGQMTDRLSEQYKKFFKKVKSFRPQSTWKPSDEQIEILDMVLTNKSMDDNIARILQELREQLKKLRESKL